jgi:hypothetical protein
MHRLSERGEESKLRHLLINLMLIKDKADKACMHMSA